MNDRINADCVESIRNQVPQAELAWRLVKSSHPGVSEFILCHLSSNVLSLKSSHQVILDSELLITQFLEVCANKPTRFWKESLGKPLRNFFRGFFKRFGDLSSPSNLRRFFGGPTKWRSKTWMANFHTQVMAKLSILQIDTTHGSCSAT